MPAPRVRRRLYALLGNSRSALFLAVLALGGCSTTGAIVGGAVGSTVLGGYVPAHELEQVYYLGSFDRLGQLPPEFYRITVRGQASIISNMRFGSGWVPAGLVDALGGRASLPGHNGDDGGSEAGGEGREVDLDEGRALVQFGPEAFRTAPRDYRLVIVMGGDPSAFFEAIDLSLGNIARVQRVQRQSAVSKTLFEQYTLLNREHDQLQALRERIERSLRTPEEAAP